jgi:hypothetical protein
MSHGQKPALRVSATAFEPTVIIYWLLKDNLCVSLSSSFRLLLLLMLMLLLLLLLVLP